METKKAAITLRMNSPQTSKEAKIRKMKKHYMQGARYYKKRMYKEAIEKAKKNMERTAKKR